MIDSYVITFPAFSARRDTSLYSICVRRISSSPRKTLRLSKSIVMAHQGDVYARNYEDGAEFSFSLPMDEKELTEEKEL